MIFNTVNEIPTRDLMVGDIVTVMGEHSEGDVPVMTGKCIPKEQTSFKRTVPTRNNLKVELYSESTTATKAYVHGAMQRYHTAVATAYIAGIQITYMDHKILQEGVIYLPTTVGFTTTNWETDKTKFVAATDQTINVCSYGAKGDGVADDTAAIQLALDTVDTLYFPAGDYLVSDSIILRGTKSIRGAGKFITTFVNNTTDAVIIKVGDLTSDTGYAPYCSLSDFSVKGNRSTTGGIDVYSKTSGNPRWRNASKDVTVSNVSLDNIGAGYALRVLSWENTISDVTIGIKQKCLKGCLISHEAQRNNFMGLYITGCDEESIMLDGTGTYVARSNLFTGTVVQQSGGTEGVVQVKGAELTTFNDLYSESNNAKGAKYIVQNYGDSYGTRLNSVVHLSGGAIVVTSAGKYVDITNIVSSNVTGNIVRLTAGSGSVSNVGWLEGTTPTGTIISDSSADKDFHIVSGNTTNNQRILNETPSLKLERTSTSGVDWELNVPSNNNFGIKAAGKTVLRINPDVPETVVDTAFRPETDGTRDLGASSRKWKKLWVTTALASEVVLSEGDKMYRLHVQDGNLRAVELTVEEIEEKLC